jgi:hypothetical protein
MHTMDQGLDRTDGPDRLQKKPPAFFAADGGGGAGRSAAQMAMHPPGGLLRVLMRPCRVRL